MRAYSWIALATVALACGGSAFTANGEGTGGSNADAGTDSGGHAGVLGRAGRGSGGSLIGNGGNVGSAGSSSIGGDISAGGLITVGGNLGIAGDLVVGGAPPIAGTTSTAGSGPDPIDKVCPKAMPTKGGACTNGLLCSYGADVRTDCRPIAKCSVGKWSISQPDCPALHACAMLNVGDKCDASSPACMQNTSEGRYCVCTGCSGGGPCSTETVWACAAGDGAPSCPKLPPNEGQACAVDAPCGYGSCSTGNGVSAVCNNGTWEWNALMCPL